MAAAFAELKADLREAWQTGDLTFREYQQELEQLKADTTIGKTVAAGRAQRQPDTPRAPPGIQYLGKSVASAPATDVTWDSWPLT